MKGCVNTMILVTAATDFEMNALLSLGDVAPPSYQHLVTGVGPTRTAQQLTRYLADNDTAIRGVVNFGVGGAFYQRKNKQLQPDILDICVADREVFGDLGICMGDMVEYLPEDLVGPVEFDLVNTLFHQAVNFFKSEKIDYHRGTFVTVNSVSGKRVRGDYLQQHWDGVCENMEGAAISQVCDMFELEMVELRCISNMVEDRNPSSWKLDEACEKVAVTAKKFLEALV